MDKRRHFIYKWEKAGYQVIYTFSNYAESDLVQSSEAAGETSASSEATGQCVAGSQGKDVPSSRQVPASLGGLSEMEKQRLVAQYGCESDEDSDYMYPHKVILFPLGHLC